MRPELMGSSFENLTLVCPDPRLTLVLTVEDLTLKPDPC